MKFEESYNKIMQQEGFKDLAAAGLLGLGAFTTMDTEAKPKSPPITQQKDISVEDFLQALIKVESMGNDKAIGDNGKAKGCLQIWDVVIQDVNRVYGTKYVHDDAFDRAKSIDIAKKYLSYYAKVFKRNNPDKVVNYEVLSRIWNGGPKGYIKNATIAYWNKVKQALYA